MRLLMLLVPLLGGCMQIQMLPYLDQALTLQEFSKEKDEQSKYVTNWDANFDRLWAAVQSGEIQKYKTRAEVEAAFGPPVLRQKQVALYRYAIQSKGPHRLYLNYDETGKLVKVEQI